MLYSNRIDVHVQHLSMEFICCHQCILNSVACICRSIWINHPWCFFFSFFSPNPWSEPNNHNIIKSKILRLLTDTLVFGCSVFSSLGPCACSKELCITHGLKFMNEYQHRMQAMHEHWACVRSLIVEIGIKYSKTRLLLVSFGEHGAFVRLNGGAA